MRWVWVNDPAFSVWVAAGRKNTSVGMSSVRSSPVAISGPSFQKVADSMRLTSRTTSHLRLARPEPLHLGLRRADGRVLPDEEVALDLAVDLVHHGLVGAVVAGQLGQQVEAEVVLRLAASPYQALSRLTV
jgi:hypothetical protein